ncbi:LysR family transcriptional regulator substrate-binding protein [Nocardioides jishulii]|uniref:LysR family transcriptional regulator n=1 Tax=Nocardioides jishulii TaxID=2575440 RepID=A0A4U2YNB9_9ACTN|nr:LysR family transcriptional regulator substrate-binding protein [Nocardioides jishulii]QCX27527.1 LysR family transcriptional regulator substrate-binding protein [Nocardioides jishulii]TKI62334.1 LysR family transcriptional regulator [Nocardioides jishulii]
MTLRLAFVPGATPDKWARAWRDRSREPLELVPIEQDEQREVLLDGRADMVLARLPMDTEDLYCIPLYEELPVVVLSKEHAGAAYDELTTADLVDEQFALGVPEGVSSAVEQLPFPEMSVKDAVEVAASGTAVVVLPMSVARLYHRKDVASVVVTDLPTTRMALAWRKDADDDRTQAFVGIVRGRTSRSSRG